MYCTSLPDHSDPDFNESLHFSRFKKHNVIFNTVSSYSYCDDHVGCLSLKTILKGEEWYGIDKRRLAIRPGHFLILNNDQHYSCNIDTHEPVEGVSIFFKQSFAAAVFRDILQQETELLDNPFFNTTAQPEFFQTLQVMEPELQLRLAGLLADLKVQGYHAGTDEYLVFFLQYLIRTLQSTSKKLSEVSAVKPSSKIEIYKRLCIAKDMLHSSFMEKPDLEKLSTTACLSVPQLIRQFKSVFKTTPYQYLIQIRLEHASALLKNSDKPVQVISWECGFENVSAFCRAFKSVYGVQPLGFRKAYL
jgi:AraC family transcriptional regulator